MIGKRTKILNKIKLQAICILALSLTCNSSFADCFNDFFSPIPTQEVIASGSMYLDSTQVDHPVLKGIFPSPSEYKAKHVRADVFTPIDKPKSVTERSYKVENYELKEIPPESPPTFENIGEFAPPSEYKSKVKQPSPPKEIISDDGEDSYVSSAVKNYYDFSEMEGKPIDGINVNGLKLVNKNIVLNAITTRNGSIFNEERLQTDLQKIYNIGYFTDSMEVEPTLNKNGTVALNFKLEENPAVRDIEIAGITVFSQNEILQFAKKLKGMPQNLNLINETIEDINSYYEDNGYILAKVTNIDDTTDGILKFEITEGVIDKIVFEGEHKTKDYIIQRNIMTQPGSVYNEEMIKKDLARIYATQIFEKVDRTITPSPDNEGEYIVAIKIKENSSNGISIGGGIDNALGVFGSLSLWEKNFLGKNQQISLSGMIGSGLLLSDSSIKNRMNYNLELSFKEPHFINADNSLLSKLYLREYGSYNIPLAIERRFGFNSQVSHKVKDNDRLYTNLGVGFENIHLKEGDYTGISNKYRLAGLDISKRARQLTGGDFVNISPGVRYSVLDSEFMPRDGLTAQANFVESLSVGDMKNTSGRLIGAVTKYIPVFKKSTLSVGARGGIKVHGDDMPEVMAFRLGGPYTIRGFRMNGVGSGNSFLMGSVELQTPLPFMDRFKYEVLKNLRLAFFVDAGKLWEPTITSKLYDRPNSAITAGVGLRINIPGLGPIAVDYGLPLTNVGKYNKQHGYFTFGTGGLYDGYYY